MQSHISMLARAAAAPVLALLVACSGTPEIEPGDGMPAPIPSPATITGMSPVSGPTGTSVTIQAAGFPGSSNVVIGFGPPNSEYSVIKNVMTDANGTVSTSVAVPGHAQTGRDYVFVVADADSDPKAISNAFHVTSSDGLVRIHGRITSEGVECLAMRSDSGRLYTLSKGVTGLKPGDQVIVEGTIAEVSTCMQGTTINVRSVQEKN